MCNRIFVVLQDAKASVKELINGEDTSSVMMGLFLMDE